MEQYFKAVPVSEKPEKGEYITILNDGRCRKYKWYGNYWGTIEDNSVTYASITHWLKPIPLQEELTVVMIAEEANKLPIKESIAVAFFKAASFAKSFYEPRIAALKEQIPQWISVKDKLPPNDETNVLTYGGGYLSPTIMRGAFIHSALGKEIGTSLAPPTHWMSILQFEKETQNK